MEVTSLPGAVSDTEAVLGISGSGPPVSNVGAMCGRTGRDLGAAFAGSTGGWEGRGLTAAGWAAGLRTGVDGGALSGGSPNASMNRRIFSASLSSGWVGLRGRAFGLGWGRRGTSSGSSPGVLEEPFGKRYGSNHQHKDELIHEMSPGNTE